MDYDSRQGYRPQDVLQGHLDYLIQRKSDLEAWLDKYDYPSQDTERRREIALCKSDLENLKGSISQFETAIERTVQNEKIILA